MTASAASARDRKRAAIGTAAFAVEPATVAGVVPWLLTRWEVQAPVPGGVPAQVAGVLLIGAGAAVITEFGDGMAGLLGPERVELSYPARSVLERGAVLPGSSDRPVAGGRPLDVMQAFAERLTPSGAVYGPAERITPAEALAAYTTGSAAATGTADHKGMLAPGFVADIVFLSADPTTAPASALGSIDVLATMVGGSLRYGAERFPAESCVPAVAR